MDGRKLSLISLVAMCLSAIAASSASAQQPKTDPMSVQGDVGFINAEDVTALALNGDLIVPVVPSATHPVSAVVSLDYLHASEIFNAVGVGGGVRVDFVGQSKARPYVQMLVSFVHESMPDVVLFDTNGGADTGFSSNGTAFSPGGGVIYPVTPTMDVVGQIDFPFSSVNGGSEHAFRLLVGVHMTIGK